MSYHSIGKDEWQAMPSMFTNPALAETLEEDTKWWCWMAMYPSTAQPGKTCVMDYGISFSKSTGMFVKTMKSGGVE